MADEKQDTQDTQDTQQDGRDTQQQGGTPASFDEYLAGQPETIRALHAESVKGLKSALEAERETRKGLEKQVRDMAGKAEKGSEAQGELEKLADKIAASDKRADFYEAAHSAGVTDIRLAHIVAEQEQLFDRKGNPDFETMKKQHPALFGGTPPAPAGNAGAGTQTPPGGAPSINDRIRALAGR